MKTLLKIMMLGVVGLVALAVFYFGSLPVRSSHLEKLTVGMTTNEVATLLGNPQEIYLDRSRETNKDTAEF
jgi:outer membrane protein assembly factor BamE (lipoprotein component of BamABCDE complex)